MVYTNQNALDLLLKHVGDEYQVHHAKMVAAIMRRLAVELNEDPDLYWQTGILHDLDYYEFPNEHPNKAIEWLKALNYEDQMINAIAAHYVGVGPIPKNLLEASLISCDELSGLVYAYSLMRPEKYVGMEVKGVVKRFKDKAFAAKINRGDITFGITYLDKFTSSKISLELLIQMMIEEFAKM
jgi:putative nucleotidyltransferase with HDIG domain